MPDTWEGLIYAEIDLSLISLAKAAADPVGHYARADVTRLLLNRSPNKRVHEFSLPMESVLTNRADRFEVQINASKTANAGQCESLPKEAGNHNQGLDQHADKGNVRSPKDS